VLQFVLIGACSGVDSYSDNGGSSMKISQCLRGSALALATLGMMVPQVSMAANPPVAGESRAAVALTDVALQEGGVLRGQVVDAQGAPQADSLVRVTHMGNAVASVQTDADGRFAVGGLRGGVHALETAEGAAAYRFWAPNTAPPVANNSVLFVNDGLVQRDQLYNVLYPGPFVQGMVFGGIITGLTYWALDYNASGS